MEDFWEWAHNDPLGFLLLVVGVASLAYLAASYAGPYVIARIPW